MTSWENVDGDCLLVADAGVWPCCKLLKKKLVGSAMVTWCHVVKVLPGREIRVRSQLVSEEAVLPCHISNVGVLS